MGRKRPVAIAHDVAHLAILLQDDVGGLEVEDLNNPGQFIVRDYLPYAGSIRSKFVT